MRIIIAPNKIILKGGVACCQFASGGVDEQRKNELVFIGRDLDEAKLRADFTKCLATGIGLGKK